MQYWLFYLGTWLYQGCQFIDAIKPGTDEEMFWGLLKILGVLGLAVVVLLILSRRKSQEVI